MTTTKTQRIQGRFSEKTFARYTQLKEDLQADDETCLHHLLDALAPKPVEVSIEDTLTQLLHCTVEEQREIAEVLDLPYTDFWTLLRKGLLREIRFVRTQHAKLATVDFEAHDTTGRRKNRVQGSSFLLIQQCVERLMQANVAARTPMEMVYISPRVIQMQTNISPAYVAEYCKQHATDLERHHQSLGFHSIEAGRAHNQRRAKYWREQRQENVGESA